MANNRDDFSQLTIRTLQQRAGNSCSNPNCRRATSGPHSISDRSVSMGEAAHITAAAQGGKRYDPSLSSEQRSSLSNGIWLCPFCAALIDKDEIKYPTKLLHEWKQQAEHAASRELEGTKLWVPGQEKNILNQGRIGIRMKGGSGDFEDTKMRNQGIGIDTEDTRLKLKKTDIQ